MDYAIIVAGGSGSRMKSQIPKQFIDLDGEPILFHTIRAFRQYSASVRIILVLPQEQLALWNELCQKHKFTTDMQIQTGGGTRFQSVKRGLELIHTEGLVAVHDGVRPLISPKTIGRAFECAGKNGSAVVATALKESIREKQGDTTVARNRSQYYLVQTPQVFQVRDLKKAYETEEKEHLTDDASVAEAAGIAIHLVEGDYENVKITTPEDVIFADAILKERKNKK